MLAAIGFAAALLIVAGVLFAKKKKINKSAAQDEEPHNEIRNDVAEAVKAEMAKFTEKLCATYPELTKNDVRMASYVKSGLSLQEVSVMSGLQPKSVNQARYRLRKALGLGQDDSLESFLISF